MTTSSSKNGANPEYERSNLPSIPRSEPYRLEHCPDVRDVKIDDSVSLAEPIIFNKAVAVKQTRFVPDSLASFASVAV